MTCYLGNKAKCVQLPVCPINVTAGGEIKVWKIKFDKLSWNRTLGRTLINLDETFKLNFKHHWAEWVSDWSVCECGGDPVRLSLKSQVKHSADCKRSWSSDPLSDLRSCDGTLHTNGTVLLFFLLKEIFVPAARSGKTAVWNSAILVLFFLERVRLYRWHGYHDKYEVEKASRYSCLLLFKREKPINSLLNKL